MSDFKEYLARIEETFIALRGTPFVLSPADVQLIQAWHGRGLPAEVVEEAVRAVFERERKRDPHRKIGGLKYCAFGVEERWAERQRRRDGSWQSPGEVLPVGALLETNLERLRAFLATAPLPPATAARSLKQVESLRERAGDPEAVEAGLKKAQDTLILAALKTLPKAEREAMEAEIRTAMEGDLAPLPSQAARFLVRRLLMDRAREKFGVPVLTLL